MSTVVAVDGPAASGKSTAARAAARRLGFRHLNSGLLYRAVAWAAHRGGWSGAGPEEAERRLDELELALEPDDGGYRVVVDRERPGERLRTEAVGEAASRVSRLGPVRERVNRLIREEAARRSLVCDGRDVGTAIFPDADLKVWLTASPRERARRRLAEEGGEPTAPELRRAAERIRARDEADAERSLDPLRRAEDSVEIDTTDLDPDAVVERIVEEARRLGLGRS